MGKRSKKNTKKRIITIIILLVIIAVSLSVLSIVSVKIYNSTLEAKQQEREKIEKKDDVNKIKLVYENISTNNIEKTEANLKTELEKQFITAEKITVKELKEKAFKITITEKNVDKSYKLNKDGTTTKIITRKIEENKNDNK